MAAGSAQVLQQVLRLIDAHDLYGSVAYPKKHTQKDISDIYLLPFATRGVFTNVALQEPFGLTVIEARAPLARAAGCGAAAGAAPQQPLCRTVGEAPSARPAGFQRGPLLDRAALAGCAC